MHYSTAIWGSVSANVTIMNIIILFFKDYNWKKNVYKLTWIILLLCWFLKGQQWDFHKFEVASLALTDFILNVAPSADRKDNRWMYVKRDFNSSYPSLHI